MRKIVYRVRSLGLIALGAMLLVTCGSFWQTAASGATAHVAAVSLSGAPVNFGIISSDSGGTGATADPATTVQRWQAYINSHGGIGGHPVKVYLENDGTNPATALQDFQDLLSKHVVAIGDDSNVDEGFKAAADKAKIPVIGASASNLGAWFETDPNFYPVSNTISGGLFGPDKVSGLSGAKKVAGLYCAEIAKCALLIPAMKSFAKATGISIVYGGAFSASSPNYASQCLAAKSAGAQAIFIAGTDPSAQVRVLDDCAKQGYHPIAVSAGPGVSAAMTSDKNIPLIWAFTGTIPWFVKNAGSGVTTFHKVMGSYLPNATSPPEVVGVWSGLQLFAKAASNAGADPTPQKIYAGLNALHGDTLGGLTAPLNFKQGQPHPLPCVFVFKVKNGVFSTPVGTSALCAKTKK